MRYQLSRLSIAILLMWCLLEPITTVDAKTTTTLRVSVQVILCNNNGVCDSFENSSECPRDCPPVPPPSPTPPPRGSSGGGSNVTPAPSVPQPSPIVQPLEVIESTQQKQTTLVDSIPPSAQPLISKKQQPSIIAKLQEVAGKIFNRLPKLVSPAALLPVVLSPSPSVPSPVSSQLAQPAMPSSLAPTPLLPTSLSTPVPPKAQRVAVIPIRQPSKAQVFVRRGAAQAMHAVIQTIKHTSETVKAVIQSAVSLLNRIWRLIL